MPNESAEQNNKHQNDSMKNDTKKTGTKNATAALADINAQIEALKQQRIGLAEPLKARHTELMGELVALETEVRELDPTWKPASLRPRADDKIVEVITTNGSPMTVEQILSAVGSIFTPWKVKNTLKKKSTGAKAVFTLADGKYAVKAST
jgi:hypothetical protein